MSMILACGRGMGPELINPSETNRYDATLVGATHQHFSDFLSCTGTLKDRPRYYKLVEGFRDSSHITMHGWTFNVIAYLRSRRGIRNAMVIEDKNSSYSDFMAVHKVYSELLKDRVEDVSKEGMYNIKRAKERLREVSDNEAVLEYAKKSFDCSIFDVHDLLNMSHDALNMHIEKIAGVTITDKWYQRLQEYRETNYAIWDQYK